jgi:NTE family protein
MRALVLSGGGVKGAYQVGALRKLMFEDGRDYDLISGISVGALNAAILCQTPPGNPKDSWSALDSVWKQVDNSHIKKSWFPLGVIESLWKPSVYNSEPLKKWILSGVDPKKVSTSGRKLRVVSVSFDTGESFVADETTPDIQNWVVASSAFPVMLTPIQINGQSWVDGGLRSITPLGEAIRAGADEIDIITCSNPDLIPPFKSKEHAAIPGYLERSLDILTNQILRADLKICGLKNMLAQQGSSDHRQIKLRVLQPSVAELTPNSLEFTQDTINKLAQMGYEDASSLQV